MACYFFCSWTVPETPLYVAHDTPMCMLLRTLSAGRVKLYFGQCCSHYKFHSITWENSTWMGCYIQYIRGDPDDWYFVTSLRTILLGINWSEWKVLVLQCWNHLRQMLYSFSSFNYFTSNFTSYKCSKNKLNVDLGKQSDKEKWCKSPKEMHFRSFFPANTCLE